jgi:putative transposase
MTHHASSYLKMRVLGAIDSVDGETQQERVEKVAQMTFLDEMGMPHNFTWRTIYTWHYRYKNYGITGVEPKPRKDKGATRKVSPEQLLEAINQVLPNFRKDKKYNRTDVYRKIIEKGILSRNDLAATTYYRYVREYDLLDRDHETNKRRLAFAMKYANDLWQGDTMFGPYVKKSDGSSVQTKLIAFIDDASRLLCHGEFFTSDSTDSLLISLKSALYKRGVPKKIYVDNGSNYSSKELILVCARLGCILLHTPVRDGASKGKIERFFRTVRDIFLKRQLDLCSLQTLNAQFFQWVENEYNHKVHSVIEMKPVDRFALDNRRIRFLQNVQETDEFFYNEEDRQVLKDNTFSFQSIRYEAPAYLYGKKIQVRFDRSKKASPVIVYYKGERIGEAKPVNFIENAQIKRESNND